MPSFRLIALSSITLGSFFSSGCLTMYAYQRSDSLLPVEIQAVREANVTSDGTARLCATSKRAPEPSDGVLELNSGRLATKDLLQSVRRHPSTSRLRRDVWNVTASPYPSCLLAQPDWERVRILEAKGPPPSRPADCNLHLPQEKYLVTVYDKPPTVIISIKDETVCAEAELRTMGASARTKLWYVAIPFTVLLDVALSPLEIIGFFVGLWTAKW